MAPTPAVISSVRARAARSAPPSTRRALCPRERSSAAPHRTTSPRGERGTATTAWFALVVVAILSIAGLVIDGGAHAAATRRAETVAQAAARAGTDAASTARVAGASGEESARQAAQEHLARAEVTGTATVVGGVVRVQTTITVPTTFLTLVGVGELVAHGDADAQIRRH